MRQPNLENARRMAAWVALPALAVFATIGQAHAVSVTDPDPDEVVTYAKDVAPILQENCQVCHQPGSIGPMSLMTYEEVRPWAELI